ncbi:unnamed protein product [Dicrocoelium dendriticum]|nr:unnamed protein product [Dicrocoelium dendriticum]
MTEVHSSNICISLQPCMDSVPEDNGGLVIDSAFNVDKILRELVHPSGLWQWGIVLLLMFSCTSVMTFPVYANSSPPHRCRMESSVELFIRERNLSFEEVSSGIGPWNLDPPYTSEGGRGCFRYKLNWTTIDLEKVFQPRHNETLTKELEPCVLGYVQEENPHYYPGNVVIEFETFCDRAWLVPLGTSLYMCGAAAGSLLAGWWAGRYGRKFALLLLSLIEVISGIWSSCARDYTSYVLSRFIINLGSTGKANIAGVLLLELTLAQYRSTFRAMLSLGIAFMYRALMALCAFYIPNWRWLNIAVVSPGLLSILYFFLLPESPRWLFSQKRYKDGMKVLYTAYRVNHFKRNKDNWQKLQQLMVWAEMTDKPVMEAKANGELRDTRLTRRLCSCSTLNSITSRHLVKETILGTMILTCITMCLPGLLFYARAVRHYVYAVGFFNAATAIPGLMVFFLFYRFIRSRRCPFLSLMCMTAVVLAVGSVYTMSWYQSSEVVLIVCSNIGLLLLQATANMCLLYIPELYPSDLRSQGFGLILCVSKIGGIICSFVNTAGENLWHGFPVLIYSVVMLLAVFSTMFLRDTSGENLPDN